MIVVVYCHLYFTENQPRLLDFYQTDFIVVNLSEFVLLAVVGHMMMEFDIGLFLLDKPKSTYMYHMMLYSCWFFISCAALWEIIFRYQISLQILIQV